MYLLVVLHKLHIAAKITKPRWKQVKAKEKNGSPKIMSVC